MSERTSAIHQAELLAYVDGKLPAERRDAVAAFLAANPDRAAEVAQWQRQNEALQALFASTVNEPVPSRLSPHVIARDGPIRRSFGLPQLVAAAVVLLALGGAIGWAGRDILNPPESAEAALITTAVTAHALYVKENRHAVEVAGTDHAHLVSWLSNRIERPISTPDLSADGFALVGGRLLPPSEYAGSGPAAQLMYENAAAERVTVYITAALPDRETVSEFTSRNRLDAFYWANDRITCTVVGDLPNDKMQAVAKKVYQQLTWRPDPAYTNG